MQVNAQKPLYIDQVKIPADINVSSGLLSLDGGLYFGAGRDLDQSSFFSGLIDDVKIYDRARVP